MADILFVTLLAGFFALAALLVRACERVVGRDEILAPADIVADAEEQAA